jgi:glutathione S-transferase
MTMSLYYSPGACSLAPHILLEEVGAPYALVLISTDKGEARADAFRRVNPKGRVPVLVQDDFVLTEAPAILLHIAASAPAHGFFPRSDIDLVRAVEWSNWLSGTVHGIAVRMIWRPADFADDVSEHVHVVARGHAHLAAAFALVESRMTGREWAVGEAYSHIDPYLLVFYRWGNRMKLDMRGTYPQWTKHALRMLARPAVERAFAQEGISAWV